MDHVVEHRRRHDPGVVLTQVAVMLADGGDTLSDLATLRHPPDLFGNVASAPTSWRVIASIHVDGLRAMTEARRQARAQAWKAGMAPESVTLDIHPCHLALREAECCPDLLHGYGHHPMLCYLDETEEALAGFLRPGNSGANDASDHIELRVLPYRLPWAFLGDLLCPACSNVSKGSPTTEA
jgi:hypothetical protein